MVVISKWETALNLAAGAFTFVPPKNSMKIDFLPVSTAGKN